jgi:hypothetical protein
MKIRKNFSTPMTREETFSTLQKVLSNLGLKNLKTKKMVEWSYLLVEYKEGFIQKGEIEFCFTAKQTKTEILINWSYPSNEENESSDNDGEFEEGAEVVTSIFSNLMRLGRSSLNHEKLIEELRLKMNATELVSTQNYSGQSTKNVIIKIKCRACLDVYDEALGKCPQCGLAG